MPVGTHASRVMPVGTHASRVMPDGTHASRVMPVGIMPVGCRSANFSGSAVSLLKCSDSQVSWCSLASISVFVLLVVRCSSFEASKYRLHPVPPSGRLHPLTSSGRLYPVVVCIQCLQVSCKSSASKLSGRLHPLLFKWLSSFSALQYESSGRVYSVRLKCSSNTGQNIAPGRSSGQQQLLQVHSRILRFLGAAIPAKSRPTVGYSTPKHPAVFDVQPQQSCLFGPHPPESIVTGPIFTGNIGGSISVPIS
uniref:Uncharacterized protein n=1 Tax=Ditylenchus dipsaci TaxID=166011 RepID=A0A915CPM1_9BILA